jgi:ATP-dependent DNA ligase
MLYAFDLLQLDGEGLRPLPLAERKCEAGDAAGAHAGRDHAPTKTVPPCSSTLQARF